MSLIHVYDLDVDFLSDVFGPKRRTMLRWYALFKEHGVVDYARTGHDDQRKSGWPPAVLERVEKYCKDHPTFYLEELRDFLKTGFPDVGNVVSLPAMCRALHHDLNLTRKVLVKAAREAAPDEVRNYQQQLGAIYSYPAQLVFLDETSKDGRHAYRRYARSRNGAKKKAVVGLPFSKGKRMSVMAALNAGGFVAWESTRGTFTRAEFHEALAKRVIPRLNPWPLPNSIVIVDSAKSHMYRQLEHAIHQTGARLLFLPPYAPELNPIDFCFGRLIGWIQKHANLVFPLYPEAVLPIAMRTCTRTSAEHETLGEYADCGYDRYGLDATVFDGLCDGED